MAHIGADLSSENPYAKKINRESPDRYKKIKPQEFQPSEINFSIPGAGFSLNRSPMSARTGILLVVSGPSGSGKTTLCRQLASSGEARYSISCTTRAPRPGEQDGIDYHFMTDEEFRSRLHAGEFLEHALVHGNLYGSLKSEVISHLREGIDVVMDIDVQGAEQVRTCLDSDIQRALVDLFVMPPSEDELHTRLSGRGTDSQETIALRMTNALEEMRHWRLYQYVLLSSTKDQDYAKFQALLNAERLRVSRILGS
jgi:guanylate kinase